MDFVQVFRKARLKAKEELNELLLDFQQKRVAGLGTIYGPPDAQLEEAMHDKNKELKICESILVPKLEPYMCVLINLPCEPLLIPEARDRFSSEMRLTFVGAGRTVK